MSVVSMKTLLESGVHFGHRTHKWNPNMKPYIFTERNGIHILNLQQTVKAIEDAYALFAVDKVTDGDVAKVDDAGREAVRSQLQNLEAMASTREFIESLRKVAKIQVAEDRLQ